MRDSNPLPQTPVKQVFSAIRLNDPKQKPKHFREILVSTASPKHGRIFPQTTAKQSWASWNDRQMIG